MEEKWQGSVIISKQKIKKYFGIEASWVSQKCDSAPMDSFLISNHEKAKKSCVLVVNIAFRYQFSIQNFCMSQM